jgi:hypothetical protein
LCDPDSNRNGDRDGHTDLASNGNTDDHIDLNAERDVQRDRCGHTDVDPKRASDRNTYCFTNRSSDGNCIATMCG